jgi:hypothetical protein
MRDLPAYPLSDEGTSRIQRKAKPNPTLRKHSTMPNTKEPLPGDPSPRLGSQNPH